MEEVLIYNCFLMAMLLIMYKAGGSLRKKWNLFSLAGVSSVLVYTINEGLRFGRGIDYNAYWKLFDRIAAGETNDSIYVNTDIGFYNFCKFLSGLGVTWQGCVMVMSFIYILSLLLFLKSYKSTIQFSLPLMVLFTFVEAENVMRWYLGFSLIMIGLYLVMQRIKIKNYICYMAFSAVGCSIHWGLIPLAFLLLLLTFRKTPIVKPFGAYVGLAISLVISFVINMSGFSSVFMALSLLSDRFAVYANDVNFWLLKQSEVNNIKNITGMIDFLCSVFILWAGYKPCVRSGKKYIFVYNLFVLSFLMLPITCQQELLHRYDTTIYFFRAIVYARILKEVYFYRILQKKCLWEPVMIVIMTFLIAVPIISSFRRDYRKSLYVWDKGNLTADKMFQIYAKDKKK